jgi:transposase
MDGAWLQARLDSGQSIESIARELGRHPSTVSYWARKHGLTSSHAERHAARGGIDRATLARLVALGCSTRQIAEELGRSLGTVRHWLRTYGLKTARTTPVRGERPIELSRRCERHGETTFIRYGAHDHYRCLLCRRERVTDRRRRVKEILVSEAGGHCQLCGYDRYLGALQFHHVDPSQKAFGLGLRGITRSLDRCREEAAKCALLCGNCHAEVEAGVARLPFQLSRAVPDRRSGTARAEDTDPG